MSDTFVFQCVLHIAKVSKAAAKRENCLTTCVTGRQIFTSFFICQKKLPEK